MKSKMPIKPNSSQLGIKHPASSSEAIHAIPSSNPMWNRQKCESHSFLQGNRPKIAGSYVQLLQGSVNVSFILSHFRIRFTQI